MRSRISILLIIFSAMCAALVAGASALATQENTGARIMQAHTHVHLHVHGGVAHTYSHAHAHAPAQNAKYTDDMALQSLRPLAEHEHVHCTDCRLHHAAPLTYVGTSAPRKGSNSLSPASIARSLPPLERKARIDRTLPDRTDVDPARELIGLRTIVLQT